MLALGTVALGTTACGDGGSPSDAGNAPDGGGVAAPAFPPECENISPMDCLLPWPSSRYLVDDPETATGRRISIPEAAMPANRRGRIRITPELFSRFDGFSPATSIITAFAGGDLDPSNLPDELHIDDSLASDSPTVILDAETNMPVAHFAEVDTWPDADPSRRPLYLRPATRLAERHRYVVAIRSLRHADGTPVQAGAYFAALRDGTPLPESSDLEARRAHFDDVFSHLEAAGVERSTLLQAWDFETSSGEALWGDSVTMRDAALRAVEADTGPRCTVTSMEAMPEPDVWRRVDGTVRVPLFLEGTDPMDYAEGRIHRGADGVPEQNGWADVPFVVSIPMSVHDRVAAGGEPARLVDYGHGLFGDRYETHAGWFRSAMQTLEMVGVGIDWWGMSGDDVARVALTLQNFGEFATTSERLGQSLVNHVALHRSFVGGGCAALPELQIPRTSGGSAPAIADGSIYYYGNSQGGIMGLALAGLAVDASRFVIGVGGMSYSVMIPRSVNWRVYGSVMANGYPDPLQRAMIMQMAQSQWDLGEPSTFAGHVVRDTLPCAPDVCPDGLTPPKHVLFQVGRDDAQVPNVSAEIAARTMGIGYVSSLTPTVAVPYGMPALSAARGEILGEDALVIYDIDGVPVLPLGTRDPGGDNDAHEGVRRAPAAIEQMDLFMRPDGHIVQTCEGACAGPRP